MVSRAQRYARRQVAWSCDQASGQALMSKLEKFAGTKIKPGRNVIKGYPVDIDDQDPSEGLSLDAVDRDAATNLLKALRAAGFKTQRAGQLGITIMASQAVAVSASLRPLAFSFNDDLDRELFAAEVEFAFRKAPRRLETWNASCAVPVRTMQEAQYVSKVARKYQAVRASSWACGPTSANFKFANAGKARAFKQAMKGLIEKGVEVTWDGNTSVKVKGRNEGDLREARALARKGEAIGLSSAGMFACGPTVKTLKFANALKAKAFMGSLKNLISQGLKANWDGNNKVTMSSSDPESLRAAVSIAKQQGGISISVPAASISADDGLGEPAAPSGDSEAPAACDISVSFQTPQAAQAAAAQAMRMGCDKVAVEGSTLKVTCPHENAQQVMSAAARAMGSGARV